MTTRQKTPTIGQLLRDKRDGGSKSAAARAIGVSRQMYNQWDDDYAIPGDEWVEPLADYLERDAHEIVIILYESWLAKKRVLVSDVLGLLTHQILATAA